MLITDPTVGMMNPTKWLFEYEALCMQEEQKYEDVVNLYKATRTGLINILGLDLLPIEGEDGKLRRMKDGEFIPLSMLIAREDIMTLLSERLEDLKTSEEVDKEIESEIEEMTSEELEGFIKEDIVFLDDPEEMKRRLAMASPESKWVLKTVIKPLPVSAEEAALPKVAKTRVVIEAT